MLNKHFVPQLVDIHRAVEFCKEHDDEELWTALIDSSIKMPYFVRSSSTTSGRTSTPPPSS